MKTLSNRNPEMLKQYDFSQGRRGRYAARYAQGTNIVLLEPDVAAKFPDSAHVNAALRRLIDTSADAPVTQRGSIHRKRSDTLVRTLRKEHGEDFLRGFRADMTLGAVLKKTGADSLVELLKTRNTAKIPERRA
jgi:hypothetical protein